MGKGVGASIEYGVWSIEYGLVHHFGWRVGRDGVATEGRADRPGQPRSTTIALTHPYLGVAGGERAAKVGA